jgi:glycosidase
MYKKIYFPLFLAIILLIAGCATLGFGDFENEWQTISAKAETSSAIVYKDSQAKSVAIAGSFNDWNASSHPLKKEGELWKIQLNLPAGEYQYKFVVNGEQWITDPVNKLTADDGYGGLNSVLNIGTAAKTTKSVTIKSDVALFEYVDKSAASVSVAGEFNDWNVNADPMQKKGDTWMLEKKLPAGDYQYKFVVNGEKWITDSNNPNKTDDGYGGENSIIKIGKGETVMKQTTTEKPQGSIPVTFTYQPLIGGKRDIYVAGDFNNWDAMANLMQEEKGVYSTTLHLKPGKYAYKFVVDGNWLVDENAKEFIGDGFGGQNSIIYAGDPKEINKLRKVDFSYKPGKVVKEVYLAGSMNDWNQKANRLEEVKSGVYKTTLLLKPGEFTYKFVVDGNDWITDPNAQSFADDGFGGKNAMIIVDETFPDVTIEIKDGEMLTYGIPTFQSLETVNPLTPTLIQFKTRAHSNDIEKVYLWKNGEKIPMEMVADDGSFEYFQKEISLKNEDENFQYCFVYEDGNKEFYLLDGMLGVSFDKNHLFTYSKDLVEPFFTPDWVKTGIYYQIFVDRFFNGDSSNDQDFSEWYYKGINIPPKPGQKYTKYTQYFNFVDDWYHVEPLRKSPYHNPDKDGYQPDYNSFYGGDIAGLHQKLNYLEDLGITIIYFNPIFEAKSNHKYDAADYKKLDPHFGTDEEFKAFVKDAHSRGIRIILDVAFNHTGETFWAFQDGKKNGPDSKYYHWYEWKKWPIPNPLPPNYKPSDYYECWWGFGEMPDLNFDLVLPNMAENSIKNIEHANPNWDVVNYILSVADYWIGEMDLDGFRLDVPNEVPFWFWKLFREHVKNIKPDAHLVGEIWSNAVEWVNNDYFDSVMNYAFFKDPVMRFFNSRNCSAKTFDRDLKPGLLLYPTQAAQTMMNLIGSHDTHRYLESANGDISRLKLAVLFSMTYVGVPHIWYGDEIAMMGAHDPDCRRPFNWKYTEDPEKVALRDYYKQLISIRKNNKALSLGSFKTLFTNGMVYAYQRTLDKENVVVVINNENSRQTLQIPVNFKDGEMRDLMKRRSFSVKNGILNIELEAMSGAILVP